MKHEKKINFDHGRLFFLFNFDVTIFLKNHHGHLFPHVRLFSFKEFLLSARLLGYGRLFFFKEKFTMLAY